MSTTAATIAISAAADAAAQEAARMACMAYVRDYEHGRATTIEMREYADCIYRLYPTPMTDGSLVVAKFCVLVIFAAMVAGVVWERKERIMSDSWVGAVLCGSMIGVVLGVVGLFLMFGVYFIL